MNSIDLSFLRDKSCFDGLLTDYFAARSALRTPRTRRENQFFIGNFRRWVLAQEQPDLTQELLLSWMLHGLKKAKVTTVTVKVVGLNHFLGFLLERGIIPYNPLRELRQGYRTRGYRGIVRELQRTQSISAVIALADYPFSGPLGSSFVAYFDFLASLGKRCENHRYHLASFERHLLHREMNDWNQVDRALIESWLTSRQAPSVHQRRCLILLLEDFFCFLIDRGEAQNSPVPSPGPHTHHWLPPRVFTREEVRMILDEVSKLTDHRLMPFRGQTYRMFFLSLYTLGLRASEGLNLRLRDIDFIQSSLTIGQTKFYKGRALPFGPRFAEALRTYIDEHPLLPDGDRNAFLFPTDSHRTPHLALGSVSRTLGLVIDQLDLATPPGIRSPCLHSFRHSFAVHWMERWLREGVDVQAKLPLLSAFLGHVDPASTQVYLTMTPERLRLIGERFQDAVEKEATR